MTDWPPEPLNPYESLENYQRRCAEMIRKDLRKEEKRAGIRWTVRGLSEMCMANSFDGQFCCDHPQRRQIRFHFLNQEWETCLHCLNGILDAFNMNWMDTPDLSRVMLEALRTPHSKEPLDARFGR